MESSVMDGAGFYNEHSAQQQQAAAAGVSMLEQAASEVPLPRDGPVVVADYGASEGRNSLRPLGAALDRIRARPEGATPPVWVVHTDLPGNDYSSLFETVARDPHSYARPGVFTFAAGRSFYEPLLPAGSVALGWSATAVVWLSRTPCPLPGHLFSYASTGERRSVWAAAAAADWETFLRLRADELRPGGQMVVTTLLSGPGYLDWMALVEAGARDAVDAGILRTGELEAMVLPTYIREPGEFVGAVERTGLPLTLAGSAVRVAPDPAFDALQDHRDAREYSRAAIAAYRAFSEPALMSALDADRTPSQRAAIAGALYEHTRARLEGAPTECAWHIGLARIRREPAPAA
jgi:hypothetical protein